MPLVMSFLSNAHFACIAYLYSAILYAHRSWIETLCIILYVYSAWAPEPVRRVYVMMTSLM